MPAHRDSDERDDRHGLTIGVLICAYCAVHDRKGGFLANFSPALESLIREQ